jgi:cation:H+ antiporter
MIKEILLIVLGFVLLIKGADFLVDGASSVAKKFHIPEIVIGLTIVSIGTSMPELFVSTTSALQGSADMSIGNIIGSNICNLLLILGLSAVISPVKFQKSTRNIEIPMCFAITVVFMVLANLGNIISFADSIILLVLFVGFLGYTLYVAKKGQAEAAENGESEQEEQNGSMLKNIFLIVIGIIGLKLGGDFTVDNAVVIAQTVGISEKVIGLTILAIGTSLPELVTSVMAAVKGNDDIAIGNIIGSNIFNMLMIIGVTAFITPLAYNVTYNVQLIILLFALILLEVFAVTKPKDNMTRSNGIVYVALYAVYMIMLFII